MPNPYSAPEISVKTLSKKLKNGHSFILMDVREPHELLHAKLNDEWTTLVPLSRLAREQLKGLPDSIQEKETEIIVMCHTGVRSAQVTAWLRQNGWNNVFNLEGGIHAYANQIDPTVGYY
jgi:rhodanese-related sulfurtransferase